MRRAGLALALASLSLALATPASPADLPVLHRHHRKFVVLRPPAVVRTTAGSWAVALPPPRDACAPGYAPAGYMESCVRHGELEVRCYPDGRCVPLPPNPIPYGLGPYYRLHYENNTALLPGFD